MARQHSEENVALARRLGIALLDPDTLEREVKLDDREEQDG